MSDTVTAKIINGLIIIGMSAYFAYVLRASLKKLYPEYKKPPWQASAAMLVLVAFCILLQVAVGFRPSPGGSQTLINLAIFFLLTVLFTAVSY